MSHSALTKPERGHSCPPFFASPERQANLLYHASLWVGTPFAAHARVKGAGVDCVQLAGAIYIECHFLRAFEPPRYTLDGGHHANKSLIEEWLETRRDFSPLGASFSTSAPGDLLAFTLAKTAWHVGVQVTGFQFVHAMYGRRVEIADLRDVTFSKRLTAAYRPILTSHLPPLT